MGQVIGTGGSVLNRIIEDSGARIKVSLVGEVLPRTGEQQARTRAMAADQSLTSRPHM